MEQLKKEMKEITKEEAFDVAIEQLKEEREKVKKLKEGLMDMEIYMKFLITGEDNNKPYSELFRASLSIIKSIEILLEETEDKNE